MERGRSTVPDIGLDLPPSSELNSFSAFRGIPPSTPTPPPDPGLSLSYISIGN